MQLFIYVKPSSLPPCIPDLIPLRKQMLYYMRAGKLHLTWLLLRLLVSQWLAGKETAGMSRTSPHRQCALVVLLFGHQHPSPCRVGWNWEPPLVNRLAGGCLQMPAGSSLLPPPPPGALFRCCSLRRRPYRTGHSKARGGISLFSSCCCRGLFPPSCSLC